MEIAEATPPSASEAEMATRLVKGIFSFITYGTGNKAKKRSKSAEMVDDTQPRISSGWMEPHIAPGVVGSQLALVGEHLVNHMIEAAMIAPWLTIAKAQSE